MAPTKVKAGSSKGANKKSTKPSSSGSSTKFEKPSVKPKTVQQKTKSTKGPLRKKKRTYTDKELGIPSLNGIRPAGVQKPPNAKKGKRFVEDRESMNAILAMVMAEKEGNIESKMMRQRQLEEVREVKHAEAEKRAQGKQKGLEERKDEIKKSRKHGRKTDDVQAEAERVTAAPNNGKPKKRVSFG